MSCQLKPDCSDTAGSVDDQSFHASGKIGKFAIKTATELKHGAVVFDTVRRFKGLERKVVILIDIGSMTDPERIYVALSRASLLLYIVGSRADIEKILLNSEGVNAA